MKFKMIYIWILIALTIIFGALGQTNNVCEWIAEVLFGILGLIMIAGFCIGAYNWFKTK